MLIAAGLLIYCSIRKSRCEFFAVNRSPAGSRLVSMCVVSGVNSIVLCLPRPRPLVLILRGHRGQLKLLTCVLLWL